MIHEKVDAWGHKHSWNYRVIQDIAPNGELFYAIHEAYMNDRGEIWAITTDPVYPSGESPEELRADAENYLKALDAPVVKYDDIPEGNEPDWGEDEWVDLEDLLKGDEE